VPDLFAFLHSMTLELAEYLENNILEIHNHKNDLNINSVNRKPFKSR